MKKHFLLILSFCSMLSFAQTNRSIDVDRSIPPKKNTIKLKAPEKPSTNSRAYYQSLEAQNLSNPKLYKQELDLSTNVTSQQFEAGNAAYTAQAADDFEVPAGAFWSITDVYVSGTSVGTAYPDSYNVIFYSNSATNLPDAVIRTENVVLTAGSSSPTLPLASPLILGPGKYWISVQAVLDFSIGGQWFWNTYTSGTPLGQPFAWTNPGNGFASPCSTVWNTASMCLAGQLSDLQFSLNGTASTSCKTITGRILSTDPTQSPRVTRDGIPSTCAAPKAYPGDISAGNFHYKTYTVQNISGAAECVTFNFTNPDATSTNQVFLVAYLGSFNPANIGANYLGDTGSSSAQGILQTMSVNIPAGATVTLVTSEVTANSTFNDDYIIDVIATNCGAILKAGEVGGKQTVGLYPNPTGGILHVNGMNVKQAKVIDASGKIIPVKNSGNEINVEKLIKGTYILQLQDKEGNIHTDKIIKK